ncbi:hypothetical protein [Caballeronia sp. S22]|uniref:hypothetical protein n=1 Tax=Caballeronia sp. S22 TaxID=3137182 RepID=UPI003530AF37
MSQSDFWHAAYWRAAAVCPADAIAEFLRTSDLIGRRLLLPRGVLVNRLEQLHATWRSRRCFERGGRIESLPYRMFEEEAAKKTSATRTAAKKVDREVKKVGEFAFQKPPSAPGCFPTAENLLFHSWVSQPVMRPRSHYTICDD